jgi:hypothetical protein
MTARDRMRASVNQRLMEDQAAELALSARRELLQSMQLEKASESTLRKTDPRIPRLADRGSKEYTLRDRRLGGDETRRTVWKEDANQDFGKEEDESPRADQKVRLTVMVKEVPEPSRGEGVASRKIMDEPRSAPAAKRQTTRKQEEVPSPRAPNLESERLLWARPRATDALGQRTGRTRWQRATREAEPQDLASRNAPRPAMNLPANATPPVTRSQIPVELMTPRTIRRPAVKVGDEQAPAKPIHGSKEEFASPRPAKTALAIKEETPTIRSEVAPASAKTEGVAVRSRLIPRHRKTATQEPEKPKAKVLADVAKGTHAPTKPAKTPTSASGRQHRANRMVAAAQQLSPKRRTSAVSAHISAQPKALAADQTLPAGAPALTGPAPDPTFTSIATPTGLFPPPVAPLPALQTQGAYIVAPECTAVTLHGVNVAGFDALTSTQTAASDLDLDPTSLAVLTQLWGINVVRVPFLAATINAGNGTLSATDVLTALDTIIAALAEVGMYALLALQAPSGTTTAGSAPPAPDATTIQAWQTLATHITSNPSANSGVLYEIFATSEALDTDWPQNAQVLIGTIRSLSPAALIFVNSGIGSVDPTNVPLRFPTGAPIFNLVYAISVDRNSVPDPDGTLLTSLVQNFPVCVTDWTGDNSPFMSNVADMFGRYGIHWIASSWNVDPLLVGGPAVQDFSPTPWGSTVMRAASYPTKPFLQPFSYESGTTS